MSSYEVLWRSEEVDYKELFLLKVKLQAALHQLDLTIGFPCTTVSVQL